jgi:putative MFS transporter
LITNGREIEAESTLKRIEDEVSADVGELPPVEEIEQPTEETPGLRSLFSGTLARWTAMLWLVWIFSTLGFYGFMAWVPTLLADRGFDLVHSLTFSLIISLGAVPGAFFAWPLSDRFGRRGPILIISLVIAAVGVAYGLSFNAVAIAVFGFLVAFFIQTGAALLYAYTPEVYPTGQRNKGTGFAYSLGRLANVFSPLIVAGIFGAFGYLPIFVYIAGCYVITALVVGLLGPRTGVVSLERINPLKKFESANSQIADIHN